MHAWRRNDFRRGIGRWHGAAAVDGQCRRKRCRKHSAAASGGRGDRANAADPCGANVGRRRRCGLRVQPPPRQRDIWEVQVRGASCSGRCSSRGALCSGGVLILRRCMFHTSSVSVISHSRACRGGASSMKKSARKPKVPATITLLTMSKGSMLTPAANTGAACDKVCIEVVTRLRLPELPVQGAVVGEICGRRRRHPTVQPPPYVPLRLGTRRSTARL